MYKRQLLHLASDPERFRDWVDSHGVGGQFILIGMQVLQVVVALIPGEVIEVGAGYAFGAVEGTSLCLSGVALGSTIIFLLTRLFGVRMVEAFISREKLYAFSFMKDEKKLNRLIFLVFFIPGTPKDLLTYCVEMCIRDSRNSANISRWSPVRPALRLCCGMSWRESSKCKF